MDSKSEISEFLRSRRANVTPDKAGLPIHGGNRRVPGLRREEVAMLAGVSVDYYTRIERGNLGGVSESVLNALASALLLDDAERSHLFDLANSAQPASGRRRSPRKKQQIRPGVQRILDAMTGAPAFVRNARLDMLAANALGQVLYAPMLESHLQPPNTARFVFLDPTSESFYGDWGRVATEVVAILRSEAGRDPYDRNLTDLIGELSTRSEDFRQRWAAHDVRFHDTGVKKISHPEIGSLTLTYEAMELSAEDGLTMFAYTAEPGSKSEESLNLLASLAASNGAATVHTQD